MRKLERAMKGRTTLIATIKRFEKAPRIGEVNRSQLTAGWYNHEEDWPANWSEWNNAK